jgi:Xaa-Pro aminopeptidase
MDVNQRLTKLRELMQRERLGAFIFPSTDPHNSEYVADHWKCREWISGFNGSAGTAVVTMTSAALWTDSRYFIAAAEQLKDTEFQLMKDGVAGTPTIAQWL